MESFHKPVAEIIPGMMSLGLAGRAIKMIPSLDMMPSSKMISKDVSKLTKDKKQTKDFIKGSTEILIGVPLIKAVAGSVAKL